MTTTTQTTETGISNPANPVSRGVLVPTTETVSVEDPNIRRRLDRRRSEMRIGDVASVINFGTKAQSELTKVSEQMIEKVRNKDIGGEISSQLNEMVLVIRGFNLSDLQNGKEPGWFAKTFAKALGPVTKALQRYETLESQIDTIVVNLEKNIGVLMKDIVMFDRMFEAAVNSFEEVKLYTQAAEEILVELDEKLIPEARAQAATGDDMASQRVSDLQSFRMRVERKINTLKKSRMLTFIGLPRIRTLQDADINAIEQTRETIQTAVPAWKQNFATLVAANRTKKAARDLANAADFTNQVLVDTAKATEKATVEVQKQVERGIFDLEAIESSQKSMIETLQERMRIYEEAAQRRVEENVKLEELEAELKQAMEAASMADMGQ